MKVDAGQIEQVIMNLAVNARDAMPQGGALTIETANVDLDAHICRPSRIAARRHTSAGRQRHRLRHGRRNASRTIFEPFFTTKEKGKGTGLGLATVFGIVKQSGGHITVYSEVGKGTTFKVYLPKVETVADSSTEKKTPALPRGTETVLLVEDEEMLRSLACRMLKAQGYDVLPAKDGEEALALHKRHAGTIHLVLTDVVMPRMGGRQTGLTDCVTYSPN